MLLQLIHRLFTYIRYVRDDIVYSSPIYLFYIFLA